ncbi:nucleotidyltransferase family protein [Sphingobacterium faecium]|uniref:nucleotidyltransferase family protein n=1 Tax=Sphingobacterium faecium TaxID=34087 RepID=UPI003D7FF460
MLSDPLSDSEWSKLHSWTKSHTLAGLIFDSLSFLIDDQLPPQSLRIKWDVRVDQTERHNTKMNQVIAAQYTSFTNSGLQPIYKKGKRLLLAMTFLCTVCREISTNILKTKVTQKSQYFLRG